VSPPTLALNWILDPRIQFHAKFNLGGVGTLAFHAPFDVLGIPYSRAFHLPFNVIGSQQWAFHAGFDVLGQSSWTFHATFDVIATVTAPTPGTQTGTGSVPVAVTLAAPANAGDTHITVTSQAGLSIGQVIKIGSSSEYRAITSLGATIGFAEPLAFSYPAGSSVTSAAGFVNGLAIFDKGGSFIGTIPVGYFTIRDAPSRVINDSGEMRFYMPRGGPDGPNPYLSLVFDDRLVLLSDDIGSEPWLGSMTVQDYGEGQVEVTVPDATLLWGGPKIKINQATSTEVSAAAVYQAVLDAMNAQRATDGELVWQADISTAAMFYGELQMEGTAGDLFSDIASRSVTEFTWRAQLSGGKVVATLVVRDEFSAPGFAVQDGPGGNVASGVRLLVDPTSIVHAVRVRGKATDLSSSQSSCSTSGDIDCFEWMQEAAGGVSSPTQLVPEGFASVSPGERRHRDEQLIELDWGLSAPEQQSAASDVTAKATAMFHSFLRAYHDRNGRPFYAKDGWQYQGPPGDLERYLTTDLDWRTRLKLVEYKGQPASLVMASDGMAQALLVQYDIQTDVYSVKRAWYTEFGGTIVATNCSVHGYNRIYTVIGGVITNVRYTPFDHSSGLVGPPATYMWIREDADGKPETVYKSLRRIISLTEEGAVTEGLYIDSDPANGPTSGVYYDPPYNTQPVFTRPTVGDPPHKIFSQVQLTSSIAADDYVSKVYDFEDRSICSWDPRRDGVGAYLNRTTIQNNAPTTSPRWSFVPWGEGDGATELTQGISASETQVLVANAFVIPQTYPYVGTIGEGLFAEDVLVSAGAGTLLTITRGYNGTTAIVHAAGETFYKKQDCDEEPDAPPDSTQTVPWPAGQAWAEKMLAKLSRPVRRLTVSVVNQNNEWATVRPGSLLDVNIQNEGPPEGIVGQFRTLGWAPSYGSGTMELLVEEVL
jgi:hypothetical protein